jgi:hypothetical protein
MSDNDDLKITLREWINFLELEISTTSNCISLYDSLKNDRKTSTSTLATFCMVGILAVITASTITVYTKMFSIMIVLLSFYCIVYYNNKHWDNLFFEDWERDQKKIGEFEIRIGKILENKFKSVAEIREEYLRVVSKFLRK